MGDGCHMVFYSIKSREKVFHQPHCTISYRIQKQYRKQFPTVEEARKQGYRMCNCCSQIGMKLRREQRSVDAFCQANNVQYEIDDGQLHITTDNDDWRIIVNGNAKKLFLYHKNKYKKREAIPSIVPGYHSQAIHYGTIREYMEYIVGHDKFRKKEAERDVRKANSGKELRKNTYHIQRGTTKQRYNAAQLYSILDDCEF